MNKIICLLGVFFLFVNCKAQQEEQTISTVELRKLLASENIQLLDVRTPEEIKQGSIASAIFINYFDTNFQKIAQKKLDTKKPVYLYCRSGNRSSKAAKLLKEKGFTVYNVLGGYNQWKKEN